MAEKNVFVCLSFHLGTCWVGPPIDNFFPSSSHLFRLREATFWNVLFPDETGTVENFLRPNFFPCFFYIAKMSKIVQKPSWQAFWSPLKQEIAHLDVEKSALSRPGKG